MKGQKPNGIYWVLHSRVGVYEGWGRPKHHLQGEKELRKMEGKKGGK